MGVDTKAYLKSTVTALDVYNLLQERYENVTYDVKPDNYDGKNVGRVSFTDGEDNRSIFLMESADVEAWEKGKLFQDDKYTYLSLGKWKRSVEIMSEILSVFGGYLDKNDCDDIEAWETYIEGDSEFKWSEFIEKQNEIITAFGNEVPDNEKIKTARLIMKYCDKLKNII